MKLITLAAVVLSGCAMFDPMPVQNGPYWFRSQSGASPLLEYVEISYRAPADCPVAAGSYGGLACGAAVRDGKQVFLIWIDASQSGPERNCTLEHERAHRNGWSHGQRAPNNSAEQCAQGMK